jgi:hypothetical protein
MSKYTSKRTKYTSKIKKLTSKIKKLTSKSKKSTIPKQTNFGDVTFHYPSCVNHGKEDSTDGRNNIRKEYLNHQNFGQSGDVKEYLTKISPPPDGPTVTNTLENMSTVPAPKKVDRRGRIKDPAVWGDYPVDEGLDSNVDMRWLLSPDSNVIWGGRKSRKSRKSRKNKK